MRRILIVLVAVVAALTPAAVFAQEAAEDTNGFIMTVDQDYVLPADQRVGAVVVIGGDADIRGTIEDALIVIGGDATIGGRVLGDLTVIGGEARLVETAAVSDIHLIDADLARAPGATVTGDINETAGWAVAGAWAVAGVVFIIGMTIALLVGGLIFAAIGGRQLAEAAGYMTTKPGQTILAGLIVALGLPITAGLLMATVLGIPAGLGLLVFLGPALVFLGYIVAGAWLGILLLRRRGPATANHHPFAEVLLGLVVLQAAFLVPFIGPLAFIVFGLWGMGALAYLAWRGFRPNDLPTPAAPGAPGVGQPLAG